MTATEHAPVRNNLFQLDNIRDSVEAELPVHHLNVRDMYSKPGFSVERSLFRGFTNRLQAYLEKRPDMGFDNKRNLARPLVYMPSGIKAWSSYMPGGFATYPVHNPEVTHLRDGQKVDFLTRRLFRHSPDAIGLRSRAHIMTWQLLQRDNYEETRWLSIACGSGQPTYDALKLLSGDYKLWLTDKDEQTLQFAEELHSVECPDQDARFKIVDVLDQPALQMVLNESSPQVIDAMGLFEYLVPSDASRLLSQLYQGLEAKGMMVFTNMSDQHPQLALHQRGLGWPGVAPRSVGDVADILNQARVPFSEVNVYRASDDVYNVYVIEKDAS